MRSSVAKEMHTIVDRRRVSSVPTCPESTRGHERNLHCIALLPSFMSALIIEVVGSGGGYI